MTSARKARKGGSTSRGPAPRPPPRAAAPVEQREVHALAEQDVPRVEVAVHARETMDPPADPPPPRHGGPLGGRARRRGPQRGRGRGAVGGPPAAPPVG